MGTSIWLHADWNALTSVGRCGRSDAACSRHCMFTCNAAVTWTTAILPQIVSPHHDHLQSTRRFVSSRHDHHKSATTACVVTGYPSQIHDRGSRHRVTLGPGPCLPFDLRNNHEWGRSRTTLLPSVCVFVLDKSFTNLQGIFEFLGPRNQPCSPGSIAHITIFQRGE